MRAFEDAHSLYLLLELTLGGELFSVLRNEKCFPERRCCFYSAMIVAAFEYLHDKKIIYRDLKPENLLMDADGYLKVVDFGFAKRVEDRTWTVCGTPEYMAPEIITAHKYEPPVDVWAFGCIIAHVGTGKIPYEQLNLQTRQQMLEVIRNGEVSPLELLLEPSSVPLSRS